MLCRDTHAKLQVKEFLVHSSTHLALLTPFPLAPTHTYQALDACLALIDPADDAYTAQTALVSQDAAFFVVELLSDESAAVAARAAKAVAALAAHSVRACVADVLRPAALRPQVDLNPVQMDFVDSGAMPALVGLLLDGPPPAADAAADALASLTAFNAEGKEAYLGELVAALERGRLEVRGTRQRWGSRGGGGGRCRRGGGRGAIALPLA